MWARRPPVEPAADNQPKWIDRQLSNCFPLRRFACIPLRNPTFLPSIGFPDFDNNFTHSMNIHVSNRLTLSFKSEKVCWDSVTWKYKSYQIGISCFYRSEINIQDFEAFVTGIFIMFRWCPSSRKLTNERNADISPNKKRYIGFKTCQAFWFPDLQN